MLRATAFLVLLGVGPYGAAAVPQGGAGGDGAAAWLSFRSGSEVLYDRYKDNQAQLMKLKRILETDGPMIRAGEYHVALTAFAAGAGDEYLENQANIQASIVRSYLKVTYGLANNRFVYRLDAETGEGNRVLVTVVKSPVPPGANQRINYVLGMKARPVKKAEDIAAGYDVPRPAPAVKDVGETLPAVRKETAATRTFGTELPEDRVMGDSLPRNGYTQGYIEGFVDSYLRREMDKCRISDTTKRLVVYENGRRETSEEAMLGGGPLSSQTHTARLVPAAPAREARTPRVRPDVHPRFGVKTNLLYWVGTTLNLEAEFYWGDRYSIGVEGLYTDWSLNLVKKHYAVSSIGPEFRYWVNGDGRFNGFYAGVYGHVGQFDAKFKWTGYTGDFYGGGLALGYVVPLGGHWGADLGIRLGYIYGDYDTYYYEKPYYMYKGSDKKGYFGPTGARISVVYRFGDR